MTQDEYNRLFLDLLDELNRLKNSQQYLEIALEQLDNQTKVTPVRVERLITAYLAVAYASVDEIQARIKRLKRSSHIKVVNE